MAAAFAASADGSVIVGKSLSSSSSASETAFRWASGEMEDIKEELLERGVTEVEGWSLKSAYGVSANGEVIVGFGRNADKEFEWWMAVLP